MDKIYEMFENGIYYTDINEGNFVVDNNAIKVIDFDPIWVKFADKDDMLKAIMEFYVSLIRRVLKKYSLDGIINSRVNNFEEAKRFTKKMEIEVRKNIR